MCNGTRPLAIQIWFPAIMLKWLREHDCPWDSLTCALAAEGGHLEVLQWAWKHGCQWEEDLEDLQRYESPRNMCYAVLGGVETGIGTLRQVTQPERAGCVVYPPSHRRS